jgi:hypothetical protein
MVPSGYQGQKTVFKIVAQTWVNISSNLLIIPNTTLANASTGLLIVTPVFTSLYLNKPIGVWGDGAIGTSLHRT